MSEPMTPITPVNCPDYGRVDVPATADTGKDTRGGESTRAEQPLTAEQERCTCARVGAHAEHCRKYTPGHDLASTELELQRLRAGWRSLRDSLDEAHEHLIGANLSLWEEEQDTARLRLALASAQRGRREARVRVAELERVAVEGRAALADLCYDHEDPGTAALGALYLLSQATMALDAQPDEAARALAQHDAQVLHAEADEIEAACPDHGARDEAWMDCHCDSVVDHLRKRAELRRLAHAAEAGEGR